MRTSGILLPIFSLPNSYGIGTLGKEAYEFVDFLEKANQTYWQVQKDPKEMLQQELQAYPMHTLCSSPNNQV